MAAASPNSNPTVPSDQDVNQLLKRLSSLENSVRQLLSEKKRFCPENHIISLEQQLEASSSPRLRTSSSSPPSNVTNSAPPVLYPVTVGKNPKNVPVVFQMPTDYPRYKRSDYDTMPEWKLDRLLQEYGLPIPETLHEKREMAIGNFLWGCQR